MLRHRVLIAITWAAVTASAVAIAWLAVSHAVATVADPLPAMISGSNSAAGPASTSSTPASVTDSTAPSSIEPAVTTAGSAASSAGTSDPTVPASSGIADPVTVPSSDDSGAPGGSSATTQSFSKAGGVVTMSCNGHTASLVSATPNQGYTVKVANSGPEEIEVAFTSPSHDSDFHGRCVNGQPAAQLTDD